MAEKPNSARRTAVYCRLTLTSRQYFAHALLLRGAVPPSVFELSLALPEPFADAPCDLFQQGGFILADVRYFRRKLTRFLADGVWLEEDVAAFGPEIE